MDLSADLKVKDEGSNNEDCHSDNDVEEIDQELADQYTYAITPQTDDPQMPALTFRSVFIGVIWAVSSFLCQVFLASANVLFSFRTNSFTVPASLAQLLAYPMGMFMARAIPTHWRFLNPGPFSIKEHVMIFIISSSAAGKPYGIDNIVIQYGKMFINDDRVNIWNALAWVATSQFVGYGIAGICRRFLVKPASMLWPQVLPSVAMFTAFHGGKHNLA